MSIATSRHVSWSYLFLEAGLIVLGVLLGLGLNAWREARVDANRSEVALEHIRTELAANQTRVAPLITQHQAVVDSLASLLQRNMQGSIALDQMNLLALQNQLQLNFSVPLLQTTAWDLATTTGTLAHLDYMLAADLSRVYARQTFYQEKLQRLNDNVYVAVNMDPAHMVGLISALYVLTNDLAVQEQRLSKAYTALLTRL